MKYWYVHNGWHALEIRPLEFVREYGNTGSKYLVFRRDDMKDTNIKVLQAELRHKDFGRLYPTREEAVEAARKLLEGNIAHFRERIADAEGRLKNLK